MDIELPTLTQQVIEVAKEASDRILAIYNTEFDVTSKEDNTPLTEADMAAHHAITDGLQQLTPQIPILSEESVNIPFDIRSQWNRYWLVDPLHPRVRKAKWRIHSKYCTDRQSSFSTWRYTHACVRSSILRQ